MATELRERERERERGKERERERERERDGDQDLNREGQSIQQKGLLLCIVLISYTHQRRSISVWSTPLIWMI